MNFFPIMVAGLLVVVAAMWANLDFLNEKLLRVKPPLCAPPYEVAWLPWKPGLVEFARNGERIVWLQFASDWDMTGHVNEKRVFSDDDLLQTLARHRVFLIKADHTNLDEEITKELKKYGRVSIPTNLIFPADPEKEMIVLPELLTPEIVMAALNQAAGR